MVNLPEAFEVGVTQSNFLEQSKDKSKDPVKNCVAGTSKSSSDKIPRLKDPSSNFYPDVENDNSNQGMT